ncbi:MAG TPA: ABC transporter ATP-binding protein [Bacteroidota bacterium]|nr:ABC transporter ATP-binding protein [Bacteroidota bacterium]
MIRADGLTKSYPGKDAVRSLSFSAGRGEIVGFLGPNGAGKTTTVKMLTGMILPTSGRATVAGYDIVRQPIEAKRRLGYVPESGALFETLTGGEYLHFIAELHHLDRSVAERRSDEFLDLFGIREQKDQRLQEYSKGMKQKVLIAAALIHQPEVLFLDEPLNGLDANAALVFKEIIRRLSSQGKTMLFCSHILDVVEKLCPRIIILNEGSIIAEGTPGSIADQSGVKTLEDAFCRLTGVRDARESAREFLEALGR